MNHSIINPDAEIKLSDGSSVTVKLLKWKRALVFFDKLKAQFDQFLTPEGGMKFDQAKLMDAIKGNAELLEWLVQECTGIDAAKLDTLDLADMGSLAVKALELNLGVIADQIKNVKGRLSLLGGRPPEAPMKSNETLAAPAS